MTIATASVSESRWRSEFRATLALSWPLVLINLAQTGMTTTDVMMMGWLGSDVLGAGALGGNLSFALLIFGIGLVSATSPMVARELGSNRHSVREVRRTVRQGFWAAAFVSVPISVILWNGEAVLLLMRQDPALAHQAGLYLKASLWHVFPALLAVVLRSFLAALQRPLWSLVVTLLAVVLNAFLNWGLMFGNLGAPALGIVGAGIATSLCTALSVIGLAVMIRFDRRLRRYSVFGRWWRADWPRFRALLALGLPIAATVTFEVTIFNAAVFLMGIIGPVALAAHSIVIQIASLTFMVPLGVAQAATVRVGHAFGAGDREGVRIAGWMAMALGVGFMLITATAFVVIPDVLTAAFLDMRKPDSAAVLAVALNFFVLAALFQVVDGAQAVAVGMLRGLHDTRVPMLIALFGYWGFGLPLGCLLAFVFGLGGVGIWIGLASGLALVAVLLVWRWLRRDALDLVKEG